MVLALAAFNVTVVEAPAAAPAAAAPAAAVVAVGRLRKEQDGILVHGEIKLLLFVVVVVVDEAAGFRLKPPGEGIKSVAGFQCREESEESATALVGEGTTAFAGSGGGGSGC